MNNEVITTEEEIFYYYDDNGTKYYTPNYVLATTRAKFFGTDDVYILK